MVSAFPARKFCNQPMRSEEGAWRWAVLSTALTNERPQSVGREPMGAQEEDLKRSGGAAQLIALLEAGEGRGGLMGVLWGSGGGGLGAYGALRPSGCSGEG